MNLAKGGVIVNAADMIEIHNELRRRGCRWYNEAMVITTGSFPPRNNLPAQLKAGEVILTAEQTRKLQEGLNELNEEPGSGPDGEDQD